MARYRRIIQRILFGVLIFIALCTAILYYFFGPFPMRWGAGVDDPSPLAMWPWPRAVRESPHPGVAHWLDHSSPDGTVVELFDFDFAANPHLRLELYDQDEDDAVPYDDHAGYWARGVGQATAHLNAKGRGRVVAAWNGLFFQYDHLGARGIGSHIAPVVLNGKMHYNVGNIRWSFGVQYRDGLPEFKTFCRPAAGILKREYDFAAVGASNLIANGQPLHLHPFPLPGEDPFPRSIPPTLADAGFVRLVDHIRTSRTSMGWSKDHRHFYLLIVKEPDSETASIIAFSQRLPLQGGWTVADVQVFWRALGVWGAVNIDGGNVTQLTCLRRDGRYDLVPPRSTERVMRMTFAPDFAGAPAGGTMMYFFIRDTTSR